MKLRLLIIPALIATALFAQGRFGGRRGANAASSTPPTTGELAQRQLQRAAAFLGLDASQTSALTGNTTLAGALTTEESTLQTNAATLKTDYSTLATEMIAASSSAPAELTTIESLINADFQLRVTAAGEIVSALQALSPALSTQQTAKLPELIGMLAGGDGEGIGGPRR